MLILCKSLGNMYFFPPKFMQHFTFFPASSSVLPTQGLRECYSTLRENQIKVLVSRDSIISLNEEKKNIWNRADLRFF